ncbi:MAG: histone deacetylase [Myxococcaceae bacterium]|nr:histone deacetylase [Myxococcaceae bacterium]
MSAPTLVLTDERMLGHDPGAGHPESPRRLHRILEVLKAAPIPGVQLRAPRPATREELLWVHTPAHVDGLERLRGQRAQLDPDTAMSEESWDAALLAAGAAVEAVDAVQSGAFANAFALVRPPGHHAEPDRAMGFCLLNNAAIAAERARRSGAQRVLVLDWDVHHGNGTQAAFWTRRDVLYVSSHQYPYYPGTGAPGEVGAGEGAGFTVNCALPSGLGDADYGAVFHDLFLPIARAYAPDLVIVSAGFDPHRADPIGGMLVTERGFAAMASAVCELTGGSKLVLLLEGGYDLGGLARSVHACAEVLAGRRDDFPTGASPAAAQAIAATRAAVAPYWRNVL